MLDQSTVCIPLRARDGTVKAYALIDAVDAPRVSPLRWFLRRDGYVARNAPRPERRAIMLHRFVLGLAGDDPREVDHQNRDRLDNRRSNLRAIPKAGNRQNLPGWTGKTSQHRGVSWRANRHCWQAMVWTAGRQHYIGSFQREEDAAEAARAARLRLMPYALD